MKQMRLVHTALSGATGVLLALVTVAGCHDSTGPTTVLEALTPVSLAGTVGSIVTPAPVVRATDPNGRPLRGVRVEFLISRGGGSVERSTVETGVDGTASVGSWTLGTRAGRQTLYASTLGSPGVTFAAMASSGPVDRIVRVEGENQPGLPGDPLPVPLVAKVLDSFDNGVAGAVVTFTVMSGDGTIQGDHATTDSAGLATSGAWALGPMIGLQQVRAQSANAQVLFSAIACESAGRAECEFVGAVRMLAFVRNGRIYRVNADGSDLVELTNGEIDSGPAWSPDGSKIAFSRDVPGGYDIHVMNADGSNVMRLTDVTGNFASWSPDGRRIAFNGRSAVTPYRNGIYVLSADDHAASPVEISQDWFAAWTPDGRIAAIDGGDIAVMNADGTNKAVFLSQHPGAWYSDPAWSPDGRRVAVTVFSNCTWDDECDTSIQLLDARSPSKAATLLVSCPRPEYCFGPKWSPLGTRIAFTWGRDIGTVVASVAAAGGQPQVIIANGSAPSWRP